MIFNNVVANQMTMNLDYLLFNSRDELLRVKVQNIVYFESEGNYTAMVTVNKLRPTVCMNLAHVEQLLAERLGDRRAMFVRVGKRHIVNIKYLYSIVPAKQRLVLSDQSTFAYQLEISKEALTKMKQLVVKLNSSK